MIVNVTPGCERCHTTKGSWTPDDVRKQYQAGKIKLISAIKKLSKTFEWSISKAKKYLTY